MRVSNVNVVGMLSINQASAGVTAAAAVLSTSTKVFEIQVQPAGYLLMFDPDAVLMIKDNGSTESADKSPVIVQIQPSDKQGTIVIEETSYGAVKFNQDTRIQHHPVMPGKPQLRYYARPFDLIQIYMTSNTSLITSSNAGLTLNIKKVTANLS